MYSTIIDTRHDSEYIPLSIFSVDSTLCYSLLYGLALILPFYKQIRLPVIALFSEQKT